jgi:hypothetical protein
MEDAMSTMPDPVTTAMMSATDAVQACTDACAEWQREVAHFVDHRLAENRRSWEALTSSRDVAGMMKVQQEWGLQAATDYTREAARLARLLTTLSLTGTTPAVQETTRIVA